MSVVGCYTMDLYCDRGCTVPSYGEFCRVQAQYTGPTEEACKSRAIKTGWTFKASGRVICPACKEE